MAGARLYVGGLDARVTERDLEDEFGSFGKIHYVWVARKPPGFAFIDYEDSRDADDAVRRMNGAHGWRVEVSRKSYGARGGGGGGDRGGRGYGGGGGGGGGREMACYNCGEVGHLARDCRARGVAPRRDRSPPRYSRRSASPRAGRSRSRSPIRRRASRSPVRRDCRSPVRPVSRSPIRPASRSPVRRVSRSPVRVSRSPARQVSRSPVRDGPPPRDISCSPHRD